MDWGETSCYPISVTRCIASIPKMTSRSNMVEKENFWQDILRKNLNKVQLTFIEAKSSNK